MSVTINRYNEMRKEQRKKDYRSEERCLGFDNDPKTPATTPSLPSLPRLGLRSTNPSTPKNELIRMDTCRAIKKTREKIETEKGKERLL